MPSRIACSHDSNVFLNDEEEETITIPTDYTQYCRRNVNLFAVIPTLFLVVVFLITRFNFANPHKEILFYISDVFLVLAFAFFFINIAPIVLGRVLKKYKNTADKIEKTITRLPFRLEDIMLFFTILAYGFNLVARIFVGPCPDDMTLWQTQTCTPQDGDVPCEVVIILYLMPLIFIITIENVSIAALIFSWFLIIGFVTFGIIYNNAWSQIWILYNSLFFVTLTFTVQRGKKVGFLRLVEINVQKKLALIHLRNQHAAETALAEQRRLVEVASVTATNERKLRVSETQQLRSLMGNVAHDLKTPLFSIEADIELLKLLFNAIPPSSVQIALATLSQKCRGQRVDLDPATIFDSLWSTCRFMIAAINRGQDFAKASMNVTLVPNQGILVKIPIQYYP